MHHPEIPQGFDCYEVYCDTEGFCDYDDHHDEHHIEDCSNCYCDGEALECWASEGGHCCYENHNRHDVHSEDHDQHEHGIILLKISTLKFFSI